jgi:RNase H-like domain found in reverse transcriptase
MEPREKLLRGTAKRLHWEDNAQEFFQQIKTEITELRHLEKLYFKYSLKIQTEASNYAIGGYTFQTINNEDRIISFLSKTLNKN